MNYFRCTVGGSGKGNAVTVTCAEEFAGLTITLAKTGKTYTKTCPSTAPYVVTFNGVENGTYTVSCTVDGQTYSETVIVQDISCVLNYGFTWRTWVDTASQLDSSDYDTLDEVLADEKALRELFLEHACVDYMAESTSSNDDLETIINDDYCAKWINLSDYALDFLGANTVIKALMDTADKYGYGEWALMPQVPTMTSDTAPMGTVTCTNYNTAGYNGFKAFDGDDSTYWLPSTNSLVERYYWIRYQCSSNVSYIATKAHLKTALDSGVTTTAYIQGYDGESWVDIALVTITENEADYEFENDTAYYGYGINFVNVTHYSSDHSTGNVSVYTLQFYAWAPKGNVPVMTSNTAPYGEAIATSNYSSKYPYYAFNNDIASQWRPADNSTNNAITYKSTNPICIKRAIISFGLTGGNRPDRTFLVRGSNDGTNYVNIGEFSVSGNTAIINKTIDCSSNEQYYLYHQVFCADSMGTSSWSWTISTLQFYGRELKVSVPIMTSDTAPYGQVSASSYYNGGGGSIYYPRLAFDGSEASGWYPNPYTNQWIKYMFPNPVRVNFIRITSAGAPTAVTGMQLFGSNDDSNYIDITNLLGTPVYLTETSANEDYKYYKLNVANFNGQGGGIEIQFYGLDYSEKEFETGTTKKWLYDHGVELETIDTTNATKDSDKITIQGTSTSTGVSSGISVASIDFTPHNTMRARFGDRIGWIALSVNMGVGTTNITYNAVNTGDANLPNNLGLNVSSVNETKNATIYLNANYLTDVKEWWLE